MTWVFDDNRPIYLQLIEQIQLDIVTAKYLPGDKLPSVRDLALDASVNPNTMQKALTELERKGLVHSQRTSGRFITEDTALIQSIKQTLASEHLKDFMDSMEQLGFTDEELNTLILTTIKGE